MSEPKTKSIDISSAAKTEIMRATMSLNNYIAGVAAGMDIEGKWSIDMQTMKFVIEDN